jgi:hypothetical protein
MTFETRFWLETGSNMWWVKPFNGFPTLSCDLQRQYIYKQTIKKHAQIRFHPKRPHTILSINDNIKMYSTIAG